MYTFFSIICPACDPDLTAGQILGMCVLDSKEQRGTHSNWVSFFAIVHVASAHCCIYLIILRTDSAIILLPTL